MINVFKDLSKKYSTPEKVQSLLWDFPYNAQKPETMKSALRVWHSKTAHCLEATHLAAAILEHRNFPTLALSMESEDNVGHVVYLFQERGRWGTIGRSKEPGLQGRRPHFRSIKELVMSYFDEYVDESGRILAYQVLNLDDSFSDWRFSLRNVWKSEKYILNMRHRPIPSYHDRYRRALDTFLRTGHPRKASWW
jgi:hypothetical protein